MSGLEQLNQAIELLKKEGVSDETFRLLAAIASCPVFDEPLDREFRKFGYKVAVELFQYSNTYWMCETEQINADPDNPVNWEGYQEYYSES
jgi:hypothetical protein